MFTDNITRETLCSGVNFTAVHDKRFKQNQIAVNFLLPLKRETAALYALMPLVLRRSCREYPDMTALNRRLKELYGARIDGGVSKRGELQIVTLYCEMLSDSYAFGGEPVLEQCAGLLCGAAFEPALENGVFKAQDVEIEKHSLCDIIDSLINDKRQYATMRLKEEMCANEAFGVSEYGSHEEAEAITPQALYDAWANMLRTAPVEIFLVGPGDAAPVKALFTKALGGFERGEAVTPTTKVLKQVDGEVKTKIDRLPVTQAKLVMGLRAGIAAPENTDAMRLAVTVLGGSPHAKLFLNVREKMSLCYYCLSYFDRCKGIVVIDSGIEENNYEKARTEILRQLDELKAGSFTDDEMRYAKLSMQNSYTTLNDSLYSIMAYYLGEAVAGGGQKLRSPSQSAEAVMTVTREQVIQAASGIALDTVYLLAGEESAADAKEAE